jgi:hypothetical protein
VSRAGRGLGQYDALEKPLPTEPLAELIKGEKESARSVLLRMTAATKSYTLFAENVPPAKAGDPAVQQRRDAIANALTSKHGFRISSAYLWPSGKELKQSKATFDMLTAPVVSSVPCSLCEDTLALKSADIS